MDLLASFSVINMPLKFSNSFGRGIFVIRKAAKYRATHRHADRFVNLETSVVHQTQFVMY